MNDTVQLWHTSSANDTQKVLDENATKILFDGNATQRISSLLRATDVNLYQLKQANDATVAEYQLQISLLLLVHIDGTLRRTLADETNKRIATKIGQLRSAPLSAILQAVWLVGTAVAWIAIRIGAYAIPCFWQWWPPCHVQLCILISLVRKRVHLKFR